jgi:DNA-binding HxlR family transcriptional regulator
MPNTNAITRALSLKIVGALRYGPRRFSQIEHTTDAKNPVDLSRVLKKLCRDGVITRHVITLGPPARIEYSLTELGADLVEPALGMTAWLDRYQERLADTRRPSNDAKAAERAQALLAGQHDAV